VDGKEPGDVVWTVIALAVPVAVVVAVRCVRAGRLIDRILTEELGPVLDHPPAGITRM
jgi:hypothetical protein